MYSGDESRTILVVSMHVGTHSDTPSRKHHLKFCTPKSFFPSIFTIFDNNCLRFVAAAPDKRVLLVIIIIRIMASVWGPCDVCVFMGS